MSCDIHAFVEKKQADGSWEAVKGVDEVQVNCLKEMQEKCKARGEMDASLFYAKRIPQAKRPSYTFIYSEQNYVSFAMLANVRNSFGDRIVPISQPKGLPDDVSKVVQKESDRWGYGGHSHSFLTLKELQEYGWDQVAFLADVGRQPYKELAHTFYTWSIPKLKELAGDDPDSVRIVFWFDS